MDDTLTLVLSKPIMLGELTYTEIELTEPTVKQLRAAAKAGGGLEWGAALISQNVPLPMAVVDKMMQRDFSRAADFFARFDTPLVTPTPSGE